jgi:hypothetical protein
MREYLRCSAFYARRIVNTMTYKIVPGFMTAALLAAALATGCGSDSKTGTPDANLDTAAVDARDTAVDAGRDVVASDAGDAAACPAAGNLVPPTVPSDNLRAPAGAVLALRLHAEGTQIYTCTAIVTDGDAGADAAADAGGDAGATTTYRWTFKAPAAALSDDGCVQVGTHYAGPTWKWTADSSSVVGMASANATPSATAIPWLLLRAISHDGAGVMAQVTFIQRVDTVGGIAPATGCDAATLGRDQPVPYTANYYFYSGPAVDGGAGDATPVDAPATDGTSDATDGASDVGD